MKKHKKKFIAAGLALLLVLGVKGCNDLKDAPKKQDTPKPSYTQTVDDNNDKDSIELGEGEKAATVLDLLNGDYIAHGDEVGEKTQGGLEVVANDNGTTKVEVPPVQTSEVDESLDDEMLRQRLEEMFGSISISPYEAGEQNTSSKSR